MNDNLKTLGSSMRTLRHHSAMILCLIGLSGCGAGLCVGAIECATMPSITLSAVEIDDSEITLSWRALPAGQNRYAVYYSTTANLGTLEEVKQNGTKAGEGVDIASYQITGLPVSRDYYFNVIATDSTGIEKVMGQRGPFCDGNGTAGNEFQVCDVGSLQYASLHLNAHFRITAAIDASDTTNWNSGKGFKPIGDCGADNSFGNADDNEFAGAMNGEMLDINGLVIRRATQDCVGVFGYTGDGAVISNLSLAQVTIEGGVGVAAVVGIAGSGTGSVDLDRISVTGSINGVVDVGGVVGYVYVDQLHISNSTTDLTLTSTGNLAGGLVGDMTGYGDCSACTITSSRTMGHVTGRDYVGGLVGYAFRGTILRASSSATVTGRDIVGGLFGYPETVTTSLSFATGAVAGRDNVGGLYGYGDAGSLSDSYATGSVSGNQYVGALSGGQDTITISRCYASGAVSGALDLGGLIGYYSSGVRSYLYWDSTTTGRTFGVGTSGVATLANNYESKNTAQMQSSASFVTWNFSNVWKIPDGGGYPVLQ